MVYCRECGEEIPESSRYCQFCGTRIDQAKNDASTEERVEKFWELVEGMIDREVTRIEENEELHVDPYLLDQFAFANEMYIIGLIRGRIGALLLTTVIESDELEVENYDLSPVYERIVESVQDREDQIREAMENPEPQKRGI